MLPSKKRLSRLEFTSFLGSKDLKTNFNTLGTLKYQKSVINKASVVISSKNIKKAVFRNKLRRQIYSIFNEYFNSNQDSLQVVLYVSKQAPSLSYQDIRAYLYELLKKASK